jgi:hypothetical protein
MIRSTVVIDSTSKGYVNLSSYTQLLATTLLTSKTMSMALVSSVPFPRLCRVDITT